jgi:hypothetical protein
VLDRHRIKVKIKEQPLRNVRHRLRKELIEVNNNDITLYQNGFREANHNNAKHRHLNA